MFPTSVRFTKLAWAIACIISSAMAIPSKAQDVLIYISVNATTGDPNADSLSYYVYAAAFVLEPAKFGDITSFTVSRHGTGGVMGGSGFSAASAVRLDRYASMSAISTGTYSVAITGSIAGSRTHNLNVNLDFLPGPISPQLVPAVKEILSTSPLPWVTVNLGQPVYFARGTHMYLWDANSKEVYGEAFDYIATSAHLPLFRLVPGQNASFRVDYQTRRLSDAFDIFSPYVDYTTTYLVKFIAAGPPQILQQPSLQEAPVGGSARFTVEASSSAAPTYQWQVSADGGAQWTDLANSGVYSGAPTEALNISGVGAAMNGYTYRCVATNSSGSSTSNSATLSVVRTSSTLLANLSARGYCGVGDRVMIGGFVVSGSAPKRVLIRAVGPTLTSQGIGQSEVLVDPTIDVYKGSSVIATNDNWGDNANAAEIIATATQIGAGNLAASDTKSSALLLTLQPGVYSFIARGSSGASGIVLLEVYDADAATPGAKFVNIATRAYSTTGNGVTIGGFVISGSASKQVLLRAVGPTLTKMNLGQADVLLDPTIELHDAIHGNETIATNDNWGDNANAGAITSAAARIGATTLDAADTKSSALLMTLQPGVYTFVAAGKSGTSGIVLVEVYDAD